MNIANLLPTIEGSLTIGVAAGWWQGEHPEDLRSTSGLDFVFAPLWPSLGAVMGYFAGMWFRSVFDGRG